jgi:hypothetical protein
VGTVVRAWVECPECIEESSAEKKLEAIEKLCREAFAGKTATPEDYFMAGVYYAFGKVLSVIKGGREEGNGA